MKQIIKKGCFLTLMFMLLGCLSLYAADDDLITKQITIELEKAGTLPDRIGSSRKDKITNLKIIGEINGTDLSMIVGWLEVIFMVILLTESFLY